jgi:5-methyltetrahydropteroyltriglutamate--homocysteine methyltransferase
MPAAFRADQVGSLTRPPALKEARAAFRAGQLDRAALREVEDRAIADALAHQQRIGVSIYTDGEMRRDAWQTDLPQAVDGFENDYPIVRTTLPDGSVRELEMHTKSIKDKLRPHRRLTAEFVPFLQEHAPGPFKVTMPSPASAARGSYKAGLTDRVYPTRAELLADLVLIYQDEMRKLADDGVAYVQLDEGFNSYVNPEWRATVERGGGDPEEMLAADIAAENACWDLLPADRTVRATHLCRGSRTVVRGKGSYDWLAERLFNELRVDRFLFEWDSDAVGGFEPLRFVPPGKTVVLGLVTSKSPVLEDQDALLRRIDDAARYVPRERLALSPQCGFGGSADNAFMTPDEQWRKLQLIVETARKAWQ